MEYRRFLHVCCRASIFLVCVVPIIGGGGSAPTFPYDLLAESSDNVDGKTADKPKADDEKRTLAQQVADGKYGLIHKELFAKPVKRPGVISYDINNEVPSDTSANFGGLNRSEICLAENHLLVVKGGFYPILDGGVGSVWPPIDDYDAPKRLAKIPRYPKVPPPFPVRFTDGGPLQILGTNRTRNISSTVDVGRLPPVDGYDPAGGQFYPGQYPYPPDASPGETPLPGSPNPSSVPGVTGNVLPPFFDALPPGTAVLPPPNSTDQNDEDDLSIYYPPPYTFYYPQDNSTKIPPGPLVPGIVLPPPPDFFGELTTPKPKPPKPTTKKPPKPTGVTVLKPLKPIYIYDENEIQQRPYVQTPKITATKIPLRAYFTSDKSEFYYYNRPRPVTNYTVQPHFYYLPVPVNNFKSHITQLEDQIRTYKKPPPKPVYQYSFEVADYHKQHQAAQRNYPKYSVQIEPAIEITTRSPPTYYNYNSNPYEAFFGKRLTTPSPPPSYRYVQPKQLYYQNKPGSYISYQLPGNEGAHFYFVTPQVAAQNGFYYQQRRV